MTVTDDLDLDLPLPVDVGAQYDDGYAVVDVETSGLCADSDRVLQVSVMQLGNRGQLQRTWSTLLDPGCGPGPVEVHGLTAQQLYGQPAYGDVAATVQQMLAGRVFVAHNAAFDWAFLSHEADRVAQRLNAKSVLCTVELTRRLGVPVADHKLATVAAYWGVAQLRAHDAVDDTRVLVDLLRHSLAVAARVRMPLPLTACASVR